MNFDQLLSAIRDREDDEGRCDVMEPIDDVDIESLFTCDGMKENVIKLEEICRFTGDNIKREKAFKLLQSVPHRDIDNILHDTLEHIVNNKNVFDGDRLKLIGLHNGNKLPFYLILFNDIYTSLKCKVECCRHILSLTHYTQEEFILAENFCLDTSRNRLEISPLKADIINILLDKSVSNKNKALKAKSTLPLEYEKSVFQTVETVTNIVNKVIPSYSLFDLSGLTVTFLNSVLSNDTRIERISPYEILLCYREMFLEDEKGFYSSLKDVEDLGGLMFLVTEKWISFQSKVIPFNQENDEKQVIFGHLNRCIRSLDFHTQKKLFYSLLNAVDSPLVLEFLLLFGKQPFVQLDREDDLEGDEKEAALNKRIGWIASYGNILSKENKLVLIVNYKESVSL